jgi:hypothetical protein
MRKRRRNQIGWIVPPRAFEFGRVALKLPERTW